MQTLIKAHSEFLEFIPKLIENKQAPKPKPAPVPTNLLPAFYPPGLYQKPTALPVEESYSTYIKPENSFQFPQLIAAETTSQYSQNERHPVTNLFNPNQASQPENTYVRPVSYQYQVNYYFLI